MSTDARIVVLVLVVMHVLGAGVGTARNIGMDWEHPWQEYREAFAVMYLAGAACLIIGLTAYWAIP